MTVKIVLVCIAAAMICASIRMERPELATAVSVAAGVAVVLLIWQGVRQSASLSSRIQTIIGMDKALFEPVFKAAGIAVISEMGMQICSDAGEKALAGRIVLASKASMLVLCMPMLENILDILGRILS